MRLDVEPEEIKIFLEELEEQIQIFEEGLLKLEKEPESFDLLSEIFRCAHTLKGSSYSVGHNTIAQLTHRMEDLLAKLRNKEVKLTADITNILLEGLDVLKILKSDLENEKEEEVDIKPFIQKINQICREKKEEIPISEDKIEKIIEEKENPKTYKIFVKISPQCEGIEIRVSQIFSYLSEMGKIYKSKPTWEELENGEVSKEVNIIFVSEKKKEEIEEILNIVPEVEKVDIELLSEKETVKEEKLVEGKSIEKKEGKISVKKVPSLKGSVVGRSIRIDVERLDALMDLLGELVIDRTRLIQLGTDLESKYEDDSTVIFLNQAFEHLDGVSTELHEQVMKTRLLSIGVIFNKFPRMIRDLSIKSGKKINLKIYGEETKLDKQIIDQMVDPLTHILRNAVDHGIEEPQERKKKGKPEEGNIILSALHHEDHILITIEDDGKGIDLDKIKEKVVKSGLITKDSIDKLTDKEILDFVFIPGFSTKEVAGEVSGRGVGMDIVKANIEKLSGSMMVETEKDKGTKINIRLPLTLAIMKSLLVEVGENIFAFPLFSVMEALMTKKEDVKTVRRKETINLREEVLPILNLKQIFELEEIKEDEEEYLWVVVVSWTDKKAGFMVDSLIGEQEIVIKPLSPLIEKVQGISGVAILGSGDIALVLDTSGLINVVIEEKIRKIA